MGKKIVIKGADFSAVAVIPAIAQPTINIVGSQVTISAETGATIKYTLDGSVPTVSYGIVYSAPFNLFGSCTVQAVAIKEGLASPVASAIYTLVTTPVISFDLLQRAISIEKPSGSTVHYTLNGVNPDQTSPEYTAPVIIDSSKNVKAIAYIGSAASAVVSQSCNVRAVTLADLVQSDLWYYTTTAGKSRSIIVFAFFNPSDWGVDISVDANSSIKCAIQFHGGNETYFKKYKDPSEVETISRSARYDTGWITPGNSRSFSPSDYDLEAAGVTYAFVNFTDATSNTGMPTLAEIMAAISVTFTNISVDH